MRIVIDGPGVLRRAASRGEAGHENVERLASEAVLAKRVLVGHLPHPRHDPLRKCRRAGPDDADHVMAVIMQRARRGAPDGAGRTKQHDAQSFCV